MPPLRGGAGDLPDRRRIPGALIGGVIVDFLPLRGVLWLAGAGALAAVPTVWSARADKHLRRLDGQAGQ
ncbi:hypothetical protein LO772_34080 [Yinghuangia sp. ASG 101]|uniref:hypothetical protein n=1 Tax=Yinghuangia sp. ASG 101 TaxID=2896848 RepID=UPI001E328C31|nr:hypothetical protein [Yinghuangia sp. ASG 101]UGQ11741.1 hypothetical protein LO772_34080 [Yinghuangia sp. ASG 101]